MTEISQRDFSTFYLNDNVFELAEGVIPTAATLAGVKLPHISIEGYSLSELKVWLGRADSSLEQLVGAYGVSKVLRDNEEVSVHPNVLAGLVQATGVQKPLSRSLWTPEKTIQGHEDLIVVTGGVAPWVNRVTDLLGNHALAHSGPGKVELVFGNRPMKSPADKRTKQVRSFEEKYKAPPLESQYAEAFVKPVLERLGYEVGMRDDYATDSGPELATMFVRSNPEAFAEGQRIIFTRVANAGIQLACQFRTAARKVHPLYDADESNPQVYVLTDEFPVAVNREQIGQPDNFQSPYTATRQAVLTARLLLQNSPIYTELLG